MLYTVVYWARKTRNPPYFVTGAYYPVSRTVLAGSGEHARNVVFNMLHAEGLETLHPKSIIPHDNPFLRPSPAEVPQC